jgi:hypothetical protein
MILLHRKTGVLINATSSWPVVITMKKKLISRHFEKEHVGCWPVQMNGNKFATNQILSKTGRSCEGADFSWLSSKASQTLLLLTRGLLRLFGSELYSK